MNHFFTALPYSNIFFYAHRYALYIFYIGFMTWSLYLIPWKLENGSSALFGFIIIINFSFFINAWLMQEQDGGLRDKPGKRRDHYHSCYCLSGLSLCQYSWSKRPNSPPLPKVVMGPYSNLLEPIHPLFNVVLDRYREAHEFFAQLWLVTRFKLHYLILICRM